MRKGLLFLAVLLCSTQLWALSLRQLILRSRQYCGDSSYATTYPRLTDERIKSYLNEGQKFASSYEWMLVRRTTFTLTGNTTEYFLPSDFQTVKKLWLNDRPLPETTLDALDANGSNWLLPSGSPQQYYVRFTTVSVIGFIPWPLSTTTGTIKMDYIVLVKDMVNPNDLPYNGSPEFFGLHESLAKYVAYRYFLLINPQMADIWGKEFLSDHARMGKIIETKPNYRPGFTADIGGQR